MINPAGEDDGGCTLNHSYIDPVEGFQSIMANTTDALIGADDGGHIILFNPAAEQMFG